MELGSRISAALQQIHLLRTFPRQQWHAGKACQEKKDLDQRATGEQKLINPVMWYIFYVYGFQDEDYYINLITPETRTYRGTTEGWWANLHSTVLRMPPKHLEWANHVPKCTTIFWAYNLSLKLLFESGGGLTKYQALPQRSFHSWG